MWLSPSAHKRVLMGLLGDPVRAKVAKKSSELLKTTQREEDAVTESSDVNK